MEQLEKRVSRIIGQMRGIQKMVQDTRDCPDILQQVSAVKKAIDGFSQEIVNLYVRKEIPKEKIKKFEKIVESIIKI